MRSLDLPQILYQPFAATGDKNTILNSPSTEDPQRANLQTGFPAITQIPIINGGVPPERKDFNGLGYLLSSFYFFTQCGGIYTFNRNVSNAIGGYPLGAVLYYTDSNGTTYKVRSLLENNTFDFVTTPSYIDNKHWAYVSSTPITQDTSASSTSNVFSTAAAQSLLNTVVHKTGDETIGGRKTFTSSMITQNISPKGNITLGTSTNTWGMMVNFQDTTGKRIARIQPMAIDTTNNRVGMWVNNADNTVEKGIYVDSDGKTSAPTPAVGDNSTKIATTAFVKAQGYAVDSNVVHKTGNETIGGVKTFNNDIHFKSSVFVDAAAGDEGGEIEFAKAPNSSLTGNIHLDSYRNSMRIFGLASNGDNRVVLNADLEENALFVPSSDKTSSAISTVGINKSSNGYVKLGNGIIIQWGKSTATSSSGYVTLPTPFSSTDYAVIINDVMANVPPSQGSNANVVGWGVIQSRSTTSFTAFLCNYENSSWWRWGEGRSFTWIAIGY